ncbi:MAG TPA: hypothetical protein VMS17_26655 [Gemmataceae bacterium]|nr:hypothetical protein [Gemmataceae bacterium]
MLINGWDVLIWRDGSALLWLYCDQPGNPTPRAVPVGPLSAADARRVAGWLSKSGPVDSDEVRRRVVRKEGRPEATR